MHVSASCGSASRFVDHAFASHESRISSASIAAIAGAVSPPSVAASSGGVVWPAFCEFGELAHRVHVEAIAPVLGLLVVHFVHLADILLVTRLHVLAERRPELLVLPRGLAGVVLDPVKHPPVLLFTFERGERERHEREYPRKRVLHREDDDAEQLFRSFNEERLDDLNAILLPRVILDQALGVASNPRSVAGSSISSMSA